MILSERLMRVAANVKSGGVVADIGCDHGFTSIYLIENGKAEGAIAADINRGPLERAKEHIESHQCEDKIKVRLSDGLKELKPGEADTILISGMGGALMEKILENGRTVAMSASELVLSPQSEIFLVRKEIHKLGFKILHEEMVYDQGKYYTIIRAEKGNEDAWGHIEYIYGKLLIEERDVTFISFMEKEKTRVEKILSGLSGKSLKAEAVKKKADLEKELADIIDVLHRMDLC